MRRALGKGLTQLLGELPSSGLMEVDIESITPNMRQPRLDFSQAAISELAESIRQNGILQPLLVRAVPGGQYELIAGERRWRAAQAAGLKVVPVLAKTAASQESLELALIENLQREDLSSYETAMAFQMLEQEFDLTHEQIALKVGKSRSAVSNALRLLRLPKQILSALRAGDVTEGQIRPLLGLPTAAEQVALFQQIVAHDLTARQVETAVRRRLEGDAAVKRSHKPWVDPNWDAAFEAVSRKLGARVKVEGSAKGGKLVITFADEDDLARIIESIGVEV